MIAKFLRLCVREVCALAAAGLVCWAAFSIWGFLMEPLNQHDLFLVVLQWIVTVVCLVVGLVVAGIVYVAVSEGGGREEQ